MIGMRGLGASGYPCCTASQLSTLQGPQYITSDPTVGLMVDPTSGIPVCDWTCGMAQYGGQLAAPSPYPGQMPGGGGSSLTTLNGNALFGLAVAGIIILSIKGF